jgi:hypothetical protein
MADGFAHTHWLFRGMLRPRLVGGSGDQERLGVPEPGLWRRAERCVRLRVGVQLAQGVPAGGRVVGVAVRRLSDKCRTCWLKSVELVSAI